MTKGLDASFFEQYMGAEPIEVTRLTACYPIERELFNPYKEFNLEQGLRTRIAEFYEILTALLYNGEWNQNRNLLHNGYGHLHPDVICRDMLIDAKSVCVTRPLKIRDSQFNSYFLHQGVSTDSKKVVYSVYRYDVKTPVDYLKGKENVLEELVSILSEKTAFMISFPFSVAVNIHNPTSSPFSSRYERDGKTGDEVADPLTQIRKSGLDKLFTSPEDFLISCGLNLREYIIKRRIFPRRVAMNECLITPFPILQIEDRDYSEWLRRFRLENHEKIIELKEQVEAERNSMLEEKAQKKCREVLDSLTIGFDFEGEDYVPDSTKVYDDIVPF